MNTSWCGRHPLQLQWQPSTGTASRGKGRHARSVRRWASQEISMFLRLGRCQIRWPWRHAPLTAQRWAEQATTRWGGRRRAPSSYPAPAKSLMRSVNLSWPLPACRHRTPPSMNCMKTRRAPPDTGTAVVRGNRAQVPTLRHTHEYRRYSSKQSSLCSTHASSAHHKISGMMSSICAADSAGQALASPTDQQCSEPDERHIQAMLERVRATLAEANALVDRSSEVPSSKFFPGKHSGSLQEQASMLRDSSAWQSQCLPFACMG